MPLDPMPDWVHTRRRQIGERIGRDHKTIHRYETASSVPNLVDLLLIADITGVPLADLLR